MEQAPSATVGVCVPPGEVSEGELEVATHTEEVSTSTNFTCGTHFYEEVEDTKDSVWIVQVSCPLLA